MQCLVIFLLALSINIANGVAIPKYIKQCRQSDPNLNKCALQSGQEAIKHLIAGEKSLRLLPLSPLRLPFVQLENRENFQLNMTDVEVYGLEKAELVDLKIDLKKREVKVNVRLDEIELRGQFHTEGRILILPIKGDGPGSVKAYDGDYSFSFHYDLVKRKDVEFAKIDRNEFTFSIKKAEFFVEKVFGDSRIGAETNRFLNENWLDVVKDFEHVIGQTIGGICNQIASSVFERVPYSEIILP